MATKTLTELANKKVYRDSNENINLDNKKNNMDGNENIHRDSNENINRDNKKELITGMSTKTLAEICNEKI